MTDHSPQSIPINRANRQLRTSTDSPETPGGAQSLRVLRLERAWIISGLLTAPQVALLAVLCTGLNRALHTRLSVADMAALAGLSINGARRALQQLLDMRVVSRLEHARGNIPATYKVNAPAQRQATGGTGLAGGTRGHTAGRTQAPLQAQSSPSAQP